MFKYEVLDNFLSYEDFQYINSLSLQNVGTNEIKVYQNKINRNGKIISTCFTEDFTRKLAKNYNFKAVEILERLSPAKLPLWEYTDFNIVVTGSNCSFPIHRDTPNKLLSGVVYLHPDKNTGTILYTNREGDNPTTIEWKQNRALFFSRSEKDSFHSYRGDGISNRVALVYNLCTHNIRDVCKIDNVNYYKVKVREFLNPYYNKLFNKIL